MKNTLFSGVATALITPFKDDGSIDVEGLSILIERQIQSGTDAIVIAGTTGEAATLSFEEFSLLVSKSNEFIHKRVPMIVGTGSNDTSKALKFSLEAEKRGADGLLMVTPYYNKTTQDGLIKHYLFIADRVHIPIILYNVPSRTGLNIVPKTLKVLSHHKNITAIKEASGDISNAMDLIATAPDISLYSGNDDQFLPFLSIGGSGIISVASNVIPKEIRNIYTFFQTQELEKAIREHYRILPLVRALFHEVNPIPVKRALQLLNLPAGNPRLPLIPCSQQTELLLKTAIREAGL